MKTLLTQRNVKAAVSRDDLRPAMKGVYFDPDENTYAATDGFILVVWPVPDDEMEGYHEPHPAPDAGVILPVSAFPTKKPEAVDLEIGDGTVISHNCESKTEHPTIREMYPNYKSLIPLDPHATNQYRITVDLALLKQLHDAIPGKNKKVTLYFGSPKRQIYVEPYAPPFAKPGDRDTFKYALVMPVLENAKF